MQTGLGIPLQMQHRNPELLFPRNYHWRRLPYVKSRSVTIASTDTPPKCAIYRAACEQYDQYRANLRRFQAILLDSAISREKIKVYISIPYPLVTSAAFERP